MTDRYTLYFLRHTQLLRFLYITPTFPIQIDNFFVSNTYTFLTLQYTSLLLPLIRLLRHTRLLRFQGITSLGPIHTRLTTHTFLLLHTLTSTILSLFLWKNKKENFLYEIYFFIHYTELTKYNINLSYKLIKFMDSISSIKVFRI